MSCSSVPAPRMVAKKSLQVSFEQLCNPFYPLGFRGLGFRDDILNILV